jgi:hypothetical protein
MPERWDFYLTNINHKPASIFGNFGLAGEVPREAAPWLLQVYVQMKSPRADGLSSPEEADDLWMLEDALVPAVTQHLRAELVGRVTTDGRRDFFFYAPDHEGLDVAVSQALVPLGYQAESDARRDPGWSFYFDVLYPTPWDWHAIRNRGVLENLKKHGDELSTPRRLHHWIYFRTPDHRATFARAARQRGFGTCALEPQKKDAGFAFGLQVHRIDPVDANAVQAVCHELFTLAAEHEGDYEVW